MTVSRKAQGHLLMLVVMTVFGLNIPINKFLYSSGLITPIALVTIRMTFAALAFWLISFFMPKEKVEKKDMLVLLVGGLTGMLLNQGFFAYGLGLTSPVDASIITTSSPLFALIIAAIILKEPITLKKAGGVLVGGIGAIFLIYASSTSISVGQKSSISGDLAVMSAQFFYSFYLVITRPVSSKYSPITLMKWMFLFASLVAFPMFCTDVAEAPIFRVGELVHYLSLLFVLLGATLLTYVLIPLAQRRIRATTISMYNNVQPLVASTIAIIAGQDKFTVEKLFAAVLIFAGVYLVTTSKSKKDIEAEKASNNGD
ncbi:MAG: DMT family transporter [Dysgonomonas sp.]